MDSVIRDKMPMDGGPAAVKLPFLVRTIVTALLVSACAWSPPAEIRRDMAAEAMVSALRKINIGLNQFRYIGKLTIDDRKRPVQAFRVAIAGQFPAQLRIDMFAPIGGSAALFASDGKHLFLFDHRSHDYYKKRFGKGSLNRFIGLDLSVGDLLELLAGRIPIGEKLIARSKLEGDGDTSQLILVDRNARVRQRIVIDDASRLVESVWYDEREAERFKARLQGRQSVDGFILPRRVDVSGAAGTQVSVAIDRFEVNVDFDDQLFAPERP